jgi:adenine-specific DNA-methyltransferase
MTKVFVGGSRAITRLDAEVKHRLDRIVEKCLAVVIGDASGADKAVQRFLAERQFEKVEVFSTDESPRNNLGGWPVRVVRPGHSRKDSDYYATRDRAMAAEATVGLMLWDGQSRGPAPRRCGRRGAGLGFGRSGCPRLLRGCAPASRSR